MKTGEEKYEIGKIHTLGLKTTKKLAIKDRTEGSLHERVRGRMILLNISLSEDVRKSIMK